MKSLRALFKKNKSDKTSLLSPSSQQLGEINELHNRTETIINSQIRSLNFYSSKILKRLKDNKDDEEAQDWFQSIMDLCRLMSSVEDRQLSAFPRMYLEKIEHDIRTRSSHLFDYEELQQNKKLIEQILEKLEKLDNKVSELFDPFEDFESACEYIKIYDEKFSDEYISIVSDGLPLNRSIIFNYDFGIQEEDNFMLIGGFLKEWDKEWDLAKKALLNYYQSIFYLKSKNDQKLKIIEEIRTFMISMESQSHEENQYDFDKMILSMLHNFIKPNKFLDSVYPIKDRFDKVIEFFCSIGLYKLKTDFMLNISIDADPVCSALIMKDADTIIDDLILSLKNRFEIDNIDKYLTYYFKTLWNKFNKKALTPDEKKEIYLPDQVSLNQYFIMNLLLKIKFETSDYHNMYYLNSEYTTISKRFSIYIDYEYFKPEIKNIIISNQIDFLNLEGLTFIKFKHNIQELAEKYPDLDLDDLSPEDQILGLASKSTYLSKSLISIVNAYFKLHCQRYIEMNNLYEQYRKDLEILEVNKLNSSDQKEMYKKYQKIWKQLDDKKIPKIKKVPAHIDLKKFIQEMISSTRDEIENNNEALQLIKIIKSLENNIFKVNPADQDIFYDKDFFKPADQDISYDNKQSNYKEPQYRGKDVFFNHNRQYSRDDSDSFSQSIKSSSGSDIFSPQRVDESRLHDFEKRRSDISYSDEDSYHSIHIVFDALKKSGQFKTQELLRYVLDASNDPNQLKKSGDTEPILLNIRDEDSAHINLIGTQQDDDSYVLYNQNNSF